MNYNFIIIPHFIWLWYDTFWGVELENLGKPYENLFLICITGSVESVFLELDSHLGHVSGYFSHCWFIFNVSFYILQLDNNVLQWTMQRSGTTLMIFYMLLVSTSSKWSYKVSSTWRLPSHLLSQLTKCIPTFSLQVVAQYLNLKRKKI